MYIIGDVCCAGDKTQNIKVKEAKVLRGGMFFRSCVFPLLPTMSLSYNKVLLIQLQHLHFGLYTDSCQHTSSLAQYQYHRSSMS
jgi:hypothetical protein